MDKDLRDINNISNKGEKNSNETRYEIRGTKRKFNNQNNGTDIRQVYEESGVKSNTEIFHQIPIKKIVKHNPTVDDNNNTNKGNPEKEEIKPQPVNEESISPKTITNLRGMSLSTILNKIVRYIIPAEKLLSYGFPVHSEGKTAIFFSIPFLKSSNYNFDKYFQNFGKNQFYFNHSGLLGFHDSFMHNSWSEFNPDFTGYEFNDKHFLLPIMYQNYGNNAPIQHNQQHLSNNNYFYYNHLNRYQINNLPWQRNNFNISNTIVKRNCERCGKLFLISPNTGIYITKDPCYYHWGKLLSYSVNISNKPNKYDRKLFYECCTNEKGSSGCTKAKLHVWNGVTTGKINGPFNHFVGTKPRKTKSNLFVQDRVLGLDCEMCYTVKGLEACKVTVVNLFGDVVYNYFIRPDNKIIDYNTRFSGIESKDFSFDNRNNVKNSIEVQNDLLNIIFTDTILVGHGLENDLRCLKIVHKRNIDTSIVFPHFYGYPYRRALKTLVFSHLNKIIQNKRTGHDSCQDATACIDLILWKIKNDLEN